MEPPIPDFDEKQVAADVMQKLLTDAFNCFYYPPVPLSVDDEFDAAMKEEK